MSFIVYDIIFLFAFCLFLGLFLYFKRKNLKREGIVLMYRSQWGIKLINSISTKYYKFLSKIEYLVIIVGYGLMALAVYMILQITYLFVTIPDFFKIIKIPPIAPLVPYLPQLFKLDYLPPFYFTYWIVVLIIAATPHEFFHGIFARKENVKIKSTGFAFIGPFPGAFVEPDEKKINKLGIKHQLSMLSAGTFANVLTSILLFIIMWLFFTLAFSPSGVVFNTYTYLFANSSQITLDNNEKITLLTGANLTSVYYNNTKYFMDESHISQIKNYSFIPLYENTPALRSRLEGVITSINGETIKNSEDLSRAISSAPTDREIIIITSVEDTEKTWSIQLIKNPRNSSNNYLGIGLIDTRSSTILGQIRDKIVRFKDPNTFYKAKFSEELALFLDQLIWWAFLISISVAIMNMLPLGIFDGGKVFYLTVLAITKSKKAAEYSYKAISLFWIFIFLFLTILWFFSLR